MAAAARSEGAHATTHVAGEGGAVCAPDDDLADRTADGRTVPDGREGVSVFKKDRTRSRVL
jgi:hypothetical protein